MFTGRESADRDRQHSTKPGNNYYTDIDNDDPAGRGKICYSPKHKIGFIIKQNYYPDEAL